MKGFTLHLTNCSLRKKIAVGAEIFLTVVSAVCVCGCGYANDGGGVGPRGAVFTLPRRLCFRGSELVDGHTITLRAVGSSGGKLVRCNASHAVSRGGILEATKNFSVEGKNDNGTSRLTAFHFQYHFRTHTMAVRKAWFVRNGEKSETSEPGFGPRSLFHFTA